MPQLLKNPQKWPKNSTTTPTNTSILTKRTTSTTTPFSVSSHRFRLSLHEHLSENNTEENGPHYKQRTQTVYEDVIESCDPQELSDTESDCFFSPMDTGPSNSTVYLKSKLRRSLSMGNLPTKSPPKHKAELRWVAVGDKLGYKGVLVRIWTGCTYMGRKKGRVPRTRFIQRGKPRRR